MSGIELIAAERERQVSVEGWTPQHDDEHEGSEMVDCARAYLWASRFVKSYGFEIVPNEFPPSWALEWWKPSADPVRNLVKAGALIAAEIDRLNRKAER